MILKTGATGTEEMKLLDFILPPLADGKYEAKIEQTIEIKDNANQTFNKTAEFYVSGRAFTLAPDSVFSVYPSENAEGNFSNELPFIVLNSKTLPWQYDLGGTPKRPWVALMVTEPGDVFAESDITVKELLTSVPSGVFYPVKSQPEIFTESQESICHVVDLTMDKYLSLRPLPEETPWLCHAKYVNLSKSEESVSCSDGFFSVVIGNRFMPSESGAAAKSTVWLVSLLGYEEAGKSGCKYVRLCALYHWDVFSVREAEPGFGSLIRAISCSEFGGNKNNELSRRGVVAREHRFRTGETSASLYCSPLVPAKAPELDRSSRRTADGRLIYDDKKGVFDVKYAGAFQLGRMISLSNEAMALKIVRWRRGLSERAYRRRLGGGVKARMPDYARLCLKLGPALNGTLESEEEKE